MLTTRCPHCGTAFRVKPEQLRLRGGRVRCGHCQAPFSALESLIDTPSAAQPAPAVPDQTPPPVVGASEQTTAQAAETRAAVEDKPFELAAPVALPEPPNENRSPFSPSWTPPPQRGVFLSPEGEIAPPMPELDPGVPAIPKLDFDFDDLEPEPEAPGTSEEPDLTPAPTPAIEEVSAPAIEDRGEETVLGWDWTAEVKPELRQEPVSENQPASETPSAEPEEPVFVSSFAGAEAKPSADWERASAGEPGLIDENDTLFEAPETVADSLLPRIEAPEAASPPVADLPPFSALDEEPPHSYSWETEHESHPARWPLIFATLILALLGLGQILLLLRHDIAQKMPVLRPAFETACAKLGCAMPWPRVTEQISLEASDLHPRPGHAGQYELSGTLRNRAAFAQAYPHIEITLNDNFNRALVRKVLPPDQWLPAAQRKTPAFEASSDLAFTVTFEALGQPAAGYTLYFFYP